MTFQSSPGSKKCLILDAVAGAGFVAKHRQSVPR